MSTKFEIVQDDQGRFCFRLLDGQQHVLLTGLPSKGKVAVQLEVQHARQAIRAGDRFVAHTDHGGEHFVVLKDKDGSVLAKSPHFAVRADVDALIAAVAASAPGAPLVDHARA